MTMELIHLSLGRKNGKAQKQEHNKTKNYENPFPFFGNLTRI